ncbi:MAG: hypothetical protein Q4G05_01615 [Clostridia bacterium]|nr:hypothetical protein [Clostridia bacterium]
MKLRYYTDNEIAELKQNMFINKIHYKRVIEYDIVFKLWCIMMRLEFPELTGKDIFNRASINTNILHDNLPYRRIAEWLKNYRKFGINYFLPELEPYHSLEKQKTEDKIDPVKLQILNYVLKELKKLEKDEIKW